MNIILQTCYFPLPLVNLKKNIKIQSHFPFWFIVSSRNDFQGVNKKYCREFVKTNWILRIGRVNKYKKNQY